MTATAITSASTLNQQAEIREVQRNGTKSDEVIPLVYGRAQVGGKPFAIDYTDGTWTVGYVVALGEINSFVQTWINGEAPVSGTTINYYTGTTVQTADPLLAAAIDSYTDTLVITRPGYSVGVAYIVLQYTNDEYSDWPKVVVEIEGRKVYNPRTTLTEYSSNPALHLGDLLSSSIYGHGYTVNATALEAAQDFCDDTSLGEVRRESFQAITAARTTDNWVETLKTYASCFVVRRGSVIYLVPDNVSASVRTFTADDIVADSFVISKKDSAQLPTVIRVRYTDTTGNEWRERSTEEVALPGVSLGTVPRRESVVKMPGITRYSQAYREAVERLNKLTLSDLRIRFDTFDEALALEIGDVITVSHPYGLTNKLMRLDADPEQISPGRWKISATEYDPLAYSDEVVSQPSYTDGNLPSTGPPTPPTNLVIGETTYQTKNGEFVSRLDIAFDASDNIFVSGYSVVVKDNLSAIVYSTNTSQTTIGTPPLRELVDYTIEVYSLSPLGTSSTALVGNFTIIGKTAIPDPPASISGIELGGEVRLNWTASTDVDAKRYEIRYGQTTGTWDDAQTVDITDSLRLATKDVPPGTWRFYVKTIDSVLQLSTSAATIDVAVTLDNDAFAAGNIDPISGQSLLTSMHESVESRTGDAAYYAAGGDSWSAMFPSAMTGTTSAVASYQTAPANAEWRSEVLDLLQNQSGAFRAEMPVIEEYSGTVSKRLGLTPDGGSVSFSTQLSQQATARLAEVSVLGSSALFKVDLPGGFVRADIIAREEAGTGTSSASLPTTITLANPYAGVRSISVTPQGTSSLSAVFDNVVFGGTSSFDVYIFNSAGTQVAADFQWQFKGV